MCLIGLHFFLPFFVLVVGSRLKDDPVRLGRFMLFVLFMRFVDLFWWVTPIFRESIGIRPADIGTPLLLGGVWLFLWAGQLQDRPLVPFFDPRVQANLGELTGEHAPADRCDRPGNDRVPLRPAARGGPRPRAPARRGLRR